MDARTVESADFPDPDKLLDVKEVLRLIPISRASWYRGLGRGDYPAGVSFGKRKFWRAGDICKLRRNGARGYSM